MDRGPYGGLPSVSALLAVSESRQWEMTVSESRQQGTVTLTGADMV